MKDFDELLDECRSLFFYGSDVDSWLLEMIMLPYLTLSWKQLPLWMRIIAPPSSGKSAHLSLFHEFEDSYVIDDLTSKCFISGFRGNGEDPSQLPHMNGKVLLVSDESTIMEQHKEERNLIQAILRKAYDGSISKAFGNLKEKVTHEAIFNIIMASTPMVDRYYQYNQALGERFINFRLQIPNKIAVSKRAVWNQAHRYRTRHKQLSRNLYRFLEEQKTRKFHSVKVDKVIRNKLITCASFIALIRTHVARDNTGRYITILPQSEVASRLVQQMVQIVVGNSIIHGKERVNKPCLDRAVYTALCSAPSLTVYILNIIWKYTTETGKKWHSMKDLMLSTGLGQLSTFQVVEDLCVHRVLQMRKGRSQGGRLIEYSLSDYCVETINDVELFKYYSHGMTPPQARKKDRFV